MLLWIALFACSVEPMKLDDEGGATKPKGKADAERAAGTGAELPLLGVRVDDGPRAIQGLRANPAAPGEFVIDARVFAWDGPPIRDGRVRFGADRLLERALLNVGGRARCEALVKHVEALYGPPSIAGCSERQWQTPTHAVRYLERPEKASCAVSLLVDGAFDLPPQPVPELAAAAWGGVELGLAPSAYAGLLPVERDEEAAGEVYSGPGPALPGIDTHGIEYRFHAGVLAEIGVRAHAEGCDALREHLVATFGPGVEGSPGELDWPACDAAIEYRYSPVFQACRATLLSPALRWQQAELGSEEADSDVRSAQAEIARFVEDEGGRLIVTGGIAEWLDKHPEFASMPTRQPLEEGLRLVGVRRDSVQFALGLRDKDVLLTLNGQPAQTFEPPADLRTLDIVVQRDGEERELRIGFDEGVFARVQAARPTFP